MKNIILIAAILALSISLISAKHKWYDPVNHYHQGPYETIYTADGNSTANPVQGIENATSGYLSVNDTESYSKLFYIFYEARNRQSNQDKTKIPIIIWLQGGPGGSSMVGNFFEQGPYTLNDNKETKRDISWNNDYHMLYVDNPRGTGYSIADNGRYVNSSGEVGKDFVQALLSFYGLDAFKDYAKTPLYIFGESYAGHYIPAIGQSIIDYNLNVPANQIKIPLTGLAVGDGLYDIESQLKDYGMFGYTMGLIDDIQRAQVESYLLNAWFSIRNQNYEAADTYVGNAQNLIVSAAGDICVYNYRIFGNYDLDFIQTFMNLNDTCTRYNVDESVCGKYVNDNDAVYQHLATDVYVSYASSLQYIIQNNVPFMIYNGQDDFLCSTPNTQNMIETLEWDGKNPFYYANFQPWVLANQTTSGMAKNHAALTFVVVDKAGHLVPYDQPYAAYEMVRRFINGDKNWTAPPTEINRPAVDSDDTFLH